MKRIISIIAIFAALACAAPASAVTDTEMEQARVIAAQCYLRWANDGSGYLDNLNPKTMAELEKGLKAKEKENIKAFKAIAVPKDYASWDKAKLVEYWAGTAFSTKGLVDKGRGGKNRARKKISAMTVAAPAPASASPATKESTSAAKDEAKKSPEPEATATSVAPENAASAVVPDLVAALSPTPADDEPFAEEEIEMKKASNSTWIYIVVLCLLVGVVVALVVFASNVMKKSAPADNSMRIVDDSDIKESREKISRYEAALNAKNQDVKSLTKRVEELTSQNASLRAKIETLTKELDAMSNRASAMPNTNLKEEPVETQSKQKPAKTSTPLRTIYLGRANAKGIFVRADRNLNPGNTVYRLDTTDGYSGTFRVASNPSIWEMGLDNPREVLSGACIVQHIDDTEGMERIVNDSAGTAIFEGGCWKVIRKAKIHFE